MVSAAVRAQLQALCEERDRALAAQQQLQRDCERAEQQRAQLAEDNCRLRERLAAQEERLRSAERALMTGSAEGAVWERRAALLKALLREALAALQSAGWAQQLDQHRVRAALEAEDAARQHSALVQRQVAEELHRCEEEAARLRLDNTKLLGCNRELTKENETLRSVRGATPAPR